MQDVSCWGRRCMYWPLGCNRLMEFVKVIRVIISIEWDWEEDRRAFGRHGREEKCWDISTGNIWRTETVWKNLRQMEGYMKRILVNITGVELFQVVFNKDQWRAVLHKVMKVRVLWNARKFLTSWENVSFSRILLHVLT